MKKCQIQEENKIKKLGEGSESIVYLYKNNNELVALKIFKDKFVSFKNIKKIPYETFLNKEKKLLLLNNSDAIEEEEKPIDLFYDKDRFIGYSMQIDRLIDFDYYYTSSRRTKLNLLIKLRDKVEKLNSNKIYIGDFNIENFKIRKDGSIKLRDIDNYSIDGLPFDRPNNLVKEYMEKCKNIKNVDNYSFNYFSLAYLMSLHQSVLENYLNEYGLPRKFDTNENKKLLKDLKNIDDNYKKRYFIDSQKKGLF